MTDKPKKLPSGIAKAIERFDAASKIWGWECDQGYNKEDLLRSEKEYTESKEALRATILRALVRAEKK